MSLGTCTGHWGVEFLQPAVVPWGPKVVTNDSGGPGGELVGLWGSALCWTTGETFFGHNGSLFWSGIDDGGECGVVAAAPVAVRGVSVPEKSSHLSGMTPRVTF